MISRGLSYGWLAARRRVRDMVLPAVTTATGAYLVVLVFGMSEGCLLYTSPSPRD